MWYQESVTFSVGATSSSTPSSSPASAARAHSARAIKQSVSSGMCGPCCSVVPIGISTASTPRSIAASTSGQVIRSMKCSATTAIFDRMSDIVDSILGVPAEALDGRSGAGQRRRALVPGLRRGRARRPDPRRGLRALQLRARDARARQALQGRRLRPARLRPVRPPGAGLRHGGLGRRPRRPDGRARDRPGARPRHLDGRDDRDRLRRQVPGADDLRRDQLRRREARRWPAA